MHTMTVLPASQTRASAGASRSTCQTPSRQWRRGIPAPLSLALHPCTSVSCVNGCHGRGGPASRGLRILCRSSPSDGSSSSDSTNRSLLENDRVLASLVTVGISGSLAIAGTEIANLLGAHINLWAEFKPLVGLDLDLVFRVGGLLILFEFILLGVPWYSGLLKQQNSQQHQPPADSTTQSDSLRASIANPEGSPAPDSTTSTQGTMARSPFNLDLVSLGIPNSMQADTLSWNLLRATLVLQQACYVAAAMLRSDIPPPVDASLIVLRETSKELLQRGLLVTFFSAWLADRCFEAGADDLVTVAGMPLYTTEACRWFVATLASLVLLRPVMADAQGLSLSVATNYALMTTQQGDEPGQDKTLQEYRLLEALQRTVRQLPARITCSLHELRGILRFTSINAVFAATGNLSASLAISVASNLLLLAYSVKGRNDLGLKLKPVDPKAARTQKKPPTIRWPAEGSSEDDDK